MEMMLETSGISKAERDNNVSKLMKVLQFQEGYLQGDILQKNFPTLFQGQLAKPVLEEPKWRRQLAERIKQNRERKDDDWISPSSYVKNRSSGSPANSSSSYSTFFN
jgi:hypothetical protein